MQKKFTFCLGALVVAVGFSAIALAQESNAPLREEGGETSDVVYTPPVIF